MASSASGRATLPTTKALSKLGCSLADPLAIALIGDLPVLATQASLEIGDQDFVWLDLRTALAELSSEQAGLACRAAFLLDWDRDTKFCGCCGAPMLDVPSVRARRCQTCRIDRFPRISPAVIVLITRQDQILLARAQRSVSGIFSLIAGFIEAGESAEECAQRETLEETGITIGDLRYLGSQAWPFPDSLMLAYTANWQAGELRLDTAELAEAGWFSRQDMPKTPEGFSISRRMIAWWLGGASGPLPP